MTGSQVKRASWGLKVSGDRMENGWTQRLEGQHEKAGVNGVTRVEKGERRGLHITVMALRGDRGKYNVLGKLRKFQDEDRRQLY